MEEKRSGEFVGAFPSYGYIKDPEDNHKLIIDEESAKIVRKIFGFADDNSKTSFAAGAVATVAAVKTVSNAGEKASKMINNTKVSMAKFGEHYKKDSGKLNEIFGGMKDKVPSGVKNSLGKGAEKAKSISSKVGNKFSKSKKKINGKKTSTSEKYKSKRGAKIRDKMMKRANHLTVAAIAGMATYATGSTDAMTALGIGYATKKTADGLFDKTSKRPFHITFSMLFDILSIERFVIFFEFKTSIDFIATFKLVI